MSDDPRRVPVVAIINTSEDVVNLLRDVFELEGWRTTVGYAVNFRTERESFSEFLAEHTPDVIVWDIAIPYEDNWAYFQQIQRSNGGVQRPFVLTTTNKRVLESLVGPTPAFEILGKPYDLDLIVAAVRRALGQER